MPDPPRRNATLADAMLLVMVMGLALVAWRGFLSMAVWRGFPDSRQWYYFQSLGAVVVLTPLSLAPLALAFRHPRASLPDLVGEPAAVVGLSTLFVLAINTALLLTVIGLAGGSLETFTGGKVFYFCRSLAEQTGMAVGSGWLIQAVGRRVRKPRTWLDASGWLLGICWMILAVISVVFTLL